MTEIERLSAELELKACEMTLDGKTFSEIAVALGFKNKHAFSRYRAKFSEFNMALDQARNDYCDYLEDQLLTIPIKYDKDTARTLSQNVMKLLAYRNPKRYGEKTQIEMNMTVDIGGALGRAETRLIDVTPQVVAITGKK